MNKADIAIGLDPMRSVVVEACAGSGKTWLLVSRLVRLLLSGVKPGEILAITYTRKAAREIEERLRQYLGELATASHEDAIAFLTQRGLDRLQAEAALPRARGLLESVLRADPAITITTFHGWFARLLSGAPLESGLAGLVLEENTRPLLDEAWAELAIACGRDPDGQVAQALLWLFESLGAFNTRKLLHRFLERRAEWQAWCAAYGGAEPGMQMSCAAFGVDCANPPFVHFFSALRRAELSAYADVLKSNGKKGADTAAKLARALLSESPEEAFELTRDALLTGKNEARAFKLVKDVLARLNGHETERIERSHRELCAAVQDTLMALDDAHNAELNRFALLAGNALLTAFQHIKRARRVMDFSDLECEVDQLLSNEQYAAFIQARLDARYRQVLLDEFQDTNPMQWRILQSWLNAYGMIEQRPRVFLVGDPKQSIYRFRRAEPKLFSAARQYFENEYGANALRNDHTRRNAQPVVDVINRLFRAEPTFEGFAEQSAARAAWPGRVEVLPLVMREIADGGDVDSQCIALRDPLHEAVVSVEDRRRTGEAEQVVARIQAMVGRWQVCKDGSERPARYGDVLILTRRKSVLEALELALRQADIPFVSPGRGGLLSTLEARDLIALMRFLADPADNLALAHVLRTPAFDVDDQTLLTIAKHGSSNWWEALRGLAGQMRGGEELSSIATMLADWLLAARHLPAHDMLDRVFHSSDWLNRYRKRVPAAMWAGVRANLEALLELTLTVDAGRYPSLSRLIDELRRLSQADDDEAPDEGLIQASSEGSGRVRIMTIHAAKGLEAPIVWLLDAHSAVKRGDGFEVVLAWPTDNDAPTHFSLLGRYRQRGAARKQIFDAEEIAADREDLNLLYVAMTRAEQVFIASGVESGKAVQADSPYQKLIRAVGSENQMHGAVYGDMPIAHSPAEISSGSLAAISHAPVQLQIGARRNDTRDTIGQAFGRALHAWLEAVTQGMPAPNLATELALTVPQTARRILDKPSLKRFFDAGQFVRAGNELSFVGPDGTIGRIDRWVDTGDALWILDYKSGTADGAPLQQYQEQMSRYIDALKAVWPGRTIRSMLIFTDGNEIALN